MTDLGTDLIITGAHPILDAAQPRGSSVTAIAMAGGTIVALGDDDDVRGWRGNDTHIVDVNGATVVAGLVDSHIHPVLALELAAGIDLSGCTTLDQLARALRERAAESPADAWLQGWGLDPNVFGAGAITAGTIDDAVGGRPTLLRLFDGHGALVSTEALRRAGVTGARAFNSTSVVVTDDQGVPTGLLLEESAMDLVGKLIPTEAFESRLEQVAGILAQMAATGLTGGHVMDCRGDTLELLSALDEQGRLPLRLRVAPWCRPDDATSGVDRLVELQARSGRLWQVAGVKLFMDGTIDGGTAWLHEPDCFGESTRPYWLDPHDYSAAVSQLHRAGVPTATHAIGDAAVAHVLDTIEGLPGQQTLRHRVEHIETLPDDQVARFAELGVTASMQPTHATDYTRADHSDNWSRRLGDIRANHGWRCADILHAGANVALGSDWPIAPYDPRLTLAAAQLRRPAARPDLGPVNPEQALTAAEALAGYTRAPAYVAGAEHHAGRIEVGFRADLTVFADNPLTVAPHELPGVAVTHTVVDGRLYDHASK